MTRRLLARLAALLDDVDAGAEAYLAELVEGLCPDAISPTAFSPTTTPLQQGGRQCLTPCRTTTRRASR
jgi:hypothetical protein